MLIVYGAYGETGQRILELAVAAGMRPVAAGRNREAVELVAGRLGLESRVASLDPTELDRAFEDASVVVSCVAPYSVHGVEVLEAALRAKAQYVDCSGEPRWVARLIRDYGRPAEEAGVCIVPAAGIGSCSNLAAKAAASGLPGVDRMSIAYRVKGMRPSRGTVASTIQLLAGGSPVVRAGETTFVFAGSRSRRFVNGWGVSFPLTDPLTLSLMWPHALTDGYIQTPGGRLGASALATGGLVSRSGVRPRLMAWTKPRAGNKPVGKAKGAFRITATGTSGDATSTVVAHVPDVYDVTARAAFEIATTLSSRGPAAPGVLATGQVFGDNQEVAARLGIQLRRP